MFEDHIPYSWPLPDANILFVIAVIIIATFTPDFLDLTGI